MWFIYSQIVYTEADWIFNNYLLKIPGSAIPPDEDD